MLRRPLASIARSVAFRSAALPIAMFLNTAFLGAALLATLLASPRDAAATLVFYYDPATGNVSFDTAGTRSGEIFVYGLGVTTALTDIRFRPENYVRLSTSPLLTRGLGGIGEGSLNTPLRGLFTIGDVLPTGLPESIWSTLFVPLGNSFSNSVAGHHSYVDVVGGGVPPVPQFIYGLPGRPFDNRFDLVDPDTLAWANQATLAYNAWTGEVILDTTGSSSGHITAFQLQSAGRFLPELWSAPVASPFASADENRLFFAADAMEPGTYSLGRVLPAGMSGPEFELIFTEARFLARAGFQQASFNFAAHGKPFATAYVIPEPATLALALVALAAASCRRRVNSPWAACKSFS